ncbi:hypothetical protein DPMN_027567 [Dreissena polymorpha]|uniref:Uncharacterized protein n=1 Tax=Dreissena polymorpha TaxID=45954 RepID=A0A9D4LTR0_DREPO|nr:hypothetical protein DPMN_027567 [Dreissena polymorpha]
MFVAPQTTSWASLWLMFVAFTFPYLQYNIAGSQAVRVRRHTSWRHSSVGKERRSVWF